MSTANKKRVEFGDFQTPDALAVQVCQHLCTLGFRPDSIIEPTCGVGAFVLAAAQAFPQTREIRGFEINPAYLETLKSRLENISSNPHIQLEHADFFSTDWPKLIQSLPGKLLVVGNFPWVTNATLGSIGGSNLPEKSNFQGFKGFEAISGKANFDISEWMLLDLLRSLSTRGGDLAMLVKTAVARKVLAHAERQGHPVYDARLIEIDAKKHFGASVDACLLILRLDPAAKPCYDFSVFSHFTDEIGHKVGCRQGLMVSNLKTFAGSSYLLGESPQKWRSGIKHDASGVMELTRCTDGYENGFGERVDLEETYLYPLLKGSDIGSNKAWRSKFVLVTQRLVGASTHPIKDLAPKTWAYLEAHGTQLDRRGSSIYAKNPRFSIFGVGDYAFKPWRIAICGLYKTLRFRLVAPIEGRPVMFDDTVYYLSFDTEDEARQTLAALESKQAINLLSSLIFWDEKRPIKTGILNVLDWSRLGTTAATQAALF